MPGRYDFVVKQGRDQSFKLTYRNADGTLQNLTGSTFAMSMRQSDSAPDPVWTWTSPTQILLTDLANGTFTIPFSSITINIPAGIYVYDLKRTQNGLNYDDLQGTISLPRAITV